MSNSTIATTDTMPSDKSQNLSNCLIFTPPCKHLSFLLLWPLLLVCGVAFFVSCQKEESKQLRSGNESSLSSVALTVDTAWDDPDTLFFK